MLRVVPYCRRCLIRGRQIRAVDAARRRVTKNDQRFVYNGYLQVANYHLSSTNYHLFVWDPTEPVATRPLVWRRSALGTQHSALFYTHDGNKNVSEIIAADGTVSAHYEYAPFGAVTAQTGALAQVNPFRFSSEYAEDDTATVYYNYRHYEPVMGRWLQRDPINERGEVLGLYGFCSNNANGTGDLLGLMKKSLRFETDKFETDYDGRYKAWSVKHNNMFRHVSDLQELMFWILAETDPFCPTGDMGGAEECCHCIEYIALSGHGARDGLELGGRVFLIDSIHKFLSGMYFHSSNLDFILLMEIIRERMCNQSTIEFIACDIGSNPDAGLWLKQFFGASTSVIMYNCKVKLIDNEVVPVNPPTMFCPSVWGGCSVPNPQAAKVRW